MTEINIDCKKNDIFDRYKMPALLVEIEKNSKTVLLNLNSVAKSLRRSSIGQNSINYYFDMLR